MPVLYRRYVAGRAVSIARVRPGIVDVAEGGLKPGVIESLELKRQTR